MPTAGGLPKRGEVWELRLPKISHADVAPVPVRFVVMERSRGDYWSLHVWSRYLGGRKLLAGPAYWFRKGWLQYVGPAGPTTRKMAGI
jgi:hypothetical protein